ncbi:MAG: hypothetical protein IT167_04490 [Bryobacterales bacterium]|nr:hypothetical protein [Bryobacterales bacterium]
MVVIIRHAPHEHMGLPAFSLGRFEPAFRYADLYKDSTQSMDIPSSTGLIVSGGQESANNSTSYLRREEELIAQALEGGKPVPGICLGAQLLAKVVRMREPQGPEVCNSTWKRLRR